MRFLLIIFCTLLSLPVLSTAQKSDLIGYVKDSQTGSPLIGTNVIIVGTSMGTAANEIGFFTIPDLKPGNYLVRATYIGYQTSEDSITVSGISNITLDFNLDYTSLEGQEVVVTAQARGQMEAINRQLNEKSIVNIISSDRIQELPDANAAESVARVPGVTIKREGGEGNKVVVRGLSPKYNAITVDGTRLTATDPDDRSTDLSMISQYMLDGIEVTKAGTPDLDADVLGGTVNFILRTAKPGFQTNVIGQGIYNGLKDTYNDNKLVLDVSNRFFNDKLGVLAQIDLENRNRSSNELGASYSNPGAKLDTINRVVLTGLNLYDIIRLNKRLNTLAVIDLDIPNGNIRYSNLNSSIGKDITQYSDMYSLGDNYKNSSSGTIDNSIQVVTESLRYKQTFFSKLHIDAFTSFSLSKNNSQRYSFNFNEQFAYTEPTLNISIPKVLEIAKNDIDNTRLNGYSYFGDFSRETERTYGVNLEFDFRLTSNLTGSIKVGNKFRKKSRAFDKNHEYAPIDAAAGLKSPRDSLIANFDRIGAVTEQGTRRMPLLAFLDDSYDPGDFFNGKYYKGPVADLDFMMEVFDYFSTYFHRYAPGASTIDEYIMHRLHQTNSILYDYSGNEDYNASYYMLDLDIGSKINIITGARSEKNITKYNSYRGYKSALPHWVYAGEPYSHKRKNSYFLPAFFARVKPFSWLNMRYAKTNTLTRPNYTDIIPLYEIDGPGSTIDYRNPDLEPGLSDNTDYNISFNQNYLGLFSVGYFEKSIEKLIYKSGRRYVPDPSEFDLPEGTAKYYLKDYTSNNPYKVKLSGVEFDYQTRLWYLPGFLSGIVFNANYTVIQSEVKYPRTVLLFDIDWSVRPPLLTTTNIDTFYTDRLIDQPDEIMNFSLGYDYKGFSGRLSMLYKSNVFMRTDFWPELRQTTDGYRRWDLSLKQDLPYDGLSIFLNISNISESIDVNRYRYGDLGLEQHYGRTIDLGFRYIFN